MLWRTCRQKPKRIWRRKLDSAESEIWLNKRTRCGSGHLQKILGRFTLALGSVVPFTLAGHTRRRGRKQELIDIEPLERFSLGARDRVHDEIQDTAAAVVFVVPPCPLREVNGE